MSNWLGFDDAAVERTGMIDGKGYRGRTKLRAMWEGEQPIDLEHVAIAKFLFSYAYGLPGKMQPTVEKRQSLIFMGIEPWKRRTEMDDITDRMLAEQAAEEKLKALEAAKPVVIEAKANDSEAPVTLELVEPPPSPEDFNPGRGR